MEKHLWTPGRSFTAFAEIAPDEIVAIIAGRDGTTSEWSRNALDQWSNNLARHLVDIGVQQGQFVAIVLPTSVEHIAATLAIYKVGACPLLVNANAPQSEQEAVLQIANPTAMFIENSSSNSAISIEKMHRLSLDSCTAPPDAVPQPFKAVPSGGSTGLPKLIVSPGAFLYPHMGHPFGEILQIEKGDLVYSPGPLYHNQAFFLSQVVLFQGGRIMLNERFNSGRALDLIEQYQPQILNVVPTMMQRILQEPNVENRDLKSVRLLWHMAAPCPEWAKRGWIELLGAQRILEIWAATEVTGLTKIIGDEWLEKPGSVGRGVLTEIQIRDEHGNRCETGGIGEIFSRFGDGSPQHHYLGSAPLSSDDDGFSSVGDMGYLDSDGYLYLVDRRTDVIISGGANIYPAEIEAILSAHPLVRDVVVIGLSDDDLGKRVHAIIEPKSSSASPTIEDMTGLCGQHLSRNKIPRSFEIIAQLPRTDAGKIRRSALRDERETKHKGTP